MPWLNVDFWDVLTPDNLHADFVRIAKTLLETKYKDRIIDRGAEYADYIEILEIKGGHVFGGGARIRKTGLPGRFNLKTGARHPLPLEKEEGLDEAVFFMYDESLKRWQRKGTESSEPLRSRSCLWIR